jgi:hypothetical protein
MSTPSKIRAPRPGRLPPFRRIIVYGVALGLWCTGAAWLLLHYFFPREGTFGRTPNPFEPWLLAAHGALAFASLWVLGLLWVAHVPIGWFSGRRRWSGSVVFVLALWLAISGYLIYYAGEQLMSLAVLLHWSVGLGAPAVFLIHRFSGEKLAKNPG